MLVNSTRNRKLDYFEHIIEILWKDFSIKHIDSLNSDFHSIVFPESFFVLRLIFGSWEVWSKLINNFIMILLVVSFIILVILGIIGLDSLIQLLQLLDNIRVNLHIFLDSLLRLGSQTLHFMFVNHVYL